MYLRLFSSLHNALVVLERTEVVSNYDANMPCSQSHIQMASGGGAAGR